MIEYKMLSQVGLTRLNNGNRMHTQIPLYIHTQIGITNRCTNMSRKVNNFSGKNCCCHSSHSQLPWEVTPAIFRAPGGQSGQVSPSKPGQTPSTTQIRSDKSRSRSIRTQLQRNVGTTTLVTIVVVQAAINRRRTN